MTDDAIDVERLPELKISDQSFEALGEFNGEDVPPVVNGATWKRRIFRDGGYVFVICRYRSQGIGSAITIEMLRPVVTGPVRDDPNAPGFNPGQGKRKR